MTHQPLLAPPPKPKILGDATGCYPTSIVGSDQGRLSFLENGTNRLLEEEDKTHILSFIQIFIGKSSSRIADKS